MSNEEKNTVIVVAYPDQSADNDPEFGISLSPRPYIH